MKEDLGGVRKDTVVWECVLGGLGFGFARRGGGGGTEGRDGRFRRGGKK